MKGPTASAEERARRFFPFPKEEHPPRSQERELDRMDQVRVVKGSERKG